jgi:hypothetical protein
MSVIGHGVEICTTATRPANPSNGTLIFDTDTNQLLVRVGSNWVSPMNNQTVSTINSGTSPFNLTVNGSDRLTIDTSGRTRLPSQPRFFAWRDAGQVNAGTVAVFNQTNINVGGHYNTSNGRFTAPITGTYYFCVSGIGFTGGTTRLYPRPNGSRWNDFHLRFANTANYADGERSWIWDMTAGQWMDIEVAEQPVYGVGTYLSWYGFLLF